MKILETKIDFGLSEELEAHGDLQMGISQARNNFLKPIKGLQLSVLSTWDDRIPNSTKNAVNTCYDRGGLN